MPLRTAALLHLSLCAGVQAQLSVDTRMVQGGQCGEAVLPCAANVPDCDIDLLASYAVEMISGLELGTCEEVGYTVAVGQTTSGDCPGTRCVDVLLYAPTGAEICGSGEIAPLTDACAAFQSVDDDATCAKTKGSRLQTKAQLTRTKTLTRGGGFRATCAAVSAAEPLSKRPRGRPGQPHRHDPTADGDGGDGRR